MTRSRAKMFTGRCVFTGALFSGSGSGKCPAVRHICNIRRSRPNAADKNPDLFGGMMDELAALPPLPPPLPPPNHSRPPSAPLLIFFHFFFSLSLFFFSIPLKMGALSTLGLRGKNSTTTTSSYPRPRSLLLRSCPLFQIHLKSLMLPGPAGAPLALKLLCSGSRQEPRFCDLQMT